MTSHTPEPWYCVPANRTLIRSEPAKQEVARASEIYMDNSERLANARRIVAAVNATTGIPTEHLEAGAVTELREVLNKIYETARRCDWQMEPYSAQDALDDLHKIASIATKTEAKLEAGEQADG